MFDKCKGNRFEKESHPQQVSSLWFILLLILFCVLFWAFYFNFYALPRPNLSEDDSGPTFNSRNARTYLRNLTEHGPKVAGSELNEVFAVDYLVDELEKIRVNMHQNHEMDVDVQVANGSLHLASSFHYQGLKNVVVRLRNRGVEDPDHCLLINSHFDTVAVSPGGGDATTLISVMLETVRILAEQEETFEHGIIFLFNGLEETGLQGSHAFITQHPWASSAKALLNLDSAGNGGREILFQASKGHTWLMNVSLMDKCLGDHLKFTLPPFYSSTTVDTRCIHSHRRWVRNCSKGASSHQTLILGYSETMEESLAWIWRTLQMDMFTIRNMTPKTLFRIIRCSTPEIMSWLWSGRWPMHSN